MDKPQQDKMRPWRELIYTLVSSIRHSSMTAFQSRLTLKRLGQTGRQAHQLSLDDSHDDGVVAVNHLLALFSQTLIRDELADLLKIPKNLSLQSESNKWLSQKCKTCHDFFLFIFKSYLSSIVLQNLLHHHHHLFTQVTWYRFLKPGNGMCKFTM